ncbi:MAG: hypothetical protein ACLP4W_02760 [Mycobacterium sp.]|uniref:hypothetical protein n=1 Tax=Mycobacterium sp. TaxID=1785 RepID=UPI003F972E05
MNAATVFACAPGVRLVAAAPFLSFTGSRRKCATTTVGANSTPLDAIVVSTFTMSIETAGHGLQCVVDDVVPERTDGDGSWLCECENPSNQQA